MGNLDEVLKSHQEAIDKLIEVIEKQVNLNDMMTKEMYRQALEIENLKKR